MGRRLYIETTVVSYLTARPSRDLIIAGHQESTHELWPRLSVDFESYISALVYEEAARGDTVQAKMRLNALKPFTMLAVDEEARSSRKISLPEGASRPSFRKMLFISQWPP